jgi:hypothetical protein
MALDTTIAGATTDSYISVTQADAMAERRLGREADSWKAASVTDKERALRQAATDIDSLVRSGTRYLTTQALLFPRTVDVDTAGDPYLLPRVKDAQYEQAAYLIHNANLISDAASRRARGLFSFSEDNLQGSISVDSQVGLISPRAESLMAGLARAARGSLRSVPLSTPTNPFEG